MANNQKQRLRQKYDTLANWGRAPNFKPLEGELIVISDAFGENSPGIKIGDGATLLSNLPYLNSAGTTIKSVTTIENGYKITLSDDSTLTIVNGKTPQREVDYWTEADKAEIKQYVDDAILNGEW